jgi:hypothetical protein
LSHCAKEVIGSEIRSYTFLILHFVLPTFSSPRSSSRGERWQKEKSERLRSPRGDGRSRCLLVFPSRQASCHLTTHQVTGYRFDADGHPRLGVALPLTPRGRGRTPREYFISREISRRPPWPQQAGSVSFIFPGRMDFTRSTVRPPGVKPGHPTSGRTRGPWWCHAAKLLPPDRTG